MFESTRCPTRERRLFYETLPVSMAVHALAVSTVLIASVWNVSFPQSSPALYRAYRADVATPPPPPPPPPRAQAQPATSSEHVQLAVPKEIVAPSVIPEVIPVVENAPAPGVEEVAGAVELGAEGGVEGGVGGGVAGGTVGGVVDSVFVDVITPAKLSETRVTVPRDKPLKMAALSKLHPVYPEVAVRRQWEDSLVVRYVIGRDGHVKDVTIVQPPQRKEFEEPTLFAIRSWRFRPFFENGEPKEVVHELTVNFRLLRKAAA